MGMLQLKTDSFENVKACHEHKQPMVGAAI